MGRAANQPGCLQPARGSFRRSRRCQRHGRQRLARVLRRLIGMRLAAHQLKHAPLAQQPGFSVRALHHFRQVAGREHLLRRPLGDQGEDPFIGRAVWVAQTLPDTLPAGCQGIIRAAPAADQGEKNPRKLPRPAFPRRGPESGEPPSKTNVSLIRISAETGTST